MHNCENCNTNMATICTECEIRLSRKVANWERERFIAYVKKQKYVSKKRLISTVQAWITTE